MKLPKARQPGACEGRYRYLFDHEPPIWICDALEEDIQRRISEAVTEAVAKAYEECAKLADAHRTCGDFAHGGRSDCHYAIAHEIRSLASAALARTS